MSPDWVGYTEKIELHTPRIANRVFAKRICTNWITRAHSNRNTGAKTSFKMKGYKMSWNGNKKFTGPLWSLWAKERKQLHYKKNLLCSKGLNEFNKSWKVYWSRVWMFLCNLLVHHYTLARTDVKKAKYGSQGLTKPYWDMKIEGL